MRYFIIICLLFVSACDEAPNGYKPEKILNRVNVDGVDCIVLKFGYAGGVTCNWEDYNKK